MLRKIRSSFILSYIFGFLREKTKLKLLKNNKSLQNKAKIIKDNYEKYITLKKFRTEFKVDVTDFETEILDLRNKIFENNNKKILSEISFKELKELNLSSM